MTNSFSLFDYILLAMGLYVLVSGIRGKGRLFTVENLKEGMEEKFMKTMRILYIVLGAVMTVNGVGSLVKYNFYTVTPATADAPAVWSQAKDLGAFSFLTVQALDIITYVCMGICLACIVVMILAIRKMTDKNAQKKQSGAQQSQARPAGSYMPSSAFNFDEPEEKEE